MCETMMRFGMSQEESYFELYKEEGQQPIDSFKNFINFWKLNAIVMDTDYKVISLAESSDSKIVSVKKGAYFPWK